MSFDGKRNTGLTFYLFERDWFILCYIHWSGKLAWGYEKKLKKKKTHCELEWKEK